MAKPKTPKIRNDGPVSVLYDRGFYHAEQEIGGITFVSKDPITLPDIYRITTEKEGAWYIRVDGTTLPDGETKALAAEFAAIEGAKAAS